MNKKIGIVGWKTGDNSFGVTTPYMEFFSQFGDVEIISATEIDVRKHLDLMVLPGGPDVDPGRYSSGDSLSYYVGKQCPFRERFDRVLLSKYINNGTSLFGICRGHQSLAAYFKCDITQDMYHPTNDYNDRAELVHHINTTEYLDISKILDKKGKYMINSIHHQSVNLENANSNSNVIPLAYYHEDIEIMAYKNFPIFSVQYHPEEFNCTISRYLISKLLNINTKGFNIELELETDEIWNMVK